MPGGVETTGEAGGATAHPGPSNWIFHFPSFWRTQTEVKTAIWFPFGSKTGPVEKPIVPAAFTATCSGLQPNGAVFDSRYFDHPAVTSAGPRMTAGGERTPTSSVMNEAKAFASLAANAWANAYLGGGVPRGRAGRGGRGGDGAGEQGGSEEGGSEKRVRHGSSYGSERPWFNRCASRGVT